MYKSLPYGKFKMSTDIMHHILHHEDAGKILELIEQTLPTFHGTGYRAIISRVDYLLADYQTNARITNCYAAAILDMLDLYWEDHARSANVRDIISEFFMCLIARDRNVTESWMTCINKNPKQKALVPY